MTMFLNTDEETSWIWLKVAPPVMMQSASERGENSDIILLIFSVKNIDVWLRIINQEIY